MRGHVGPTCWEQRVKTLLQTTEPLKEGAENCAWESEFPFVSPTTCNVTEQTPWETLGTLSYRCL